MMYRILIILIAFCSSVSGQSGDCGADFLQKEMESRKTLFSQMYRPGNLMENYDFGNVHLYDFKSEHTLVFFWKTDCPFCKKLLAEIRLILQKNDSTKVQVIGVCLDEDKSNWDKHEFVALNTSPNLLNIYADKGYFSDIAIQYHIYATPSMIILDDKHQFQKLPKNQDELRKMFGYN
ncbi:TlpA disulfide reductase family protein [uncultured Chryseobacterium sp.]|uniref:TlpA family protein disulfide reductase n=1 Tax=uncultured Chryseobacterium sp. TaxID=259322 RepID=UPI0025F35E29|nr:TlpA disulfide reductase family protein [uncultured Chryseobacterium sp.]